MLLNDQRLNKILLKTDVRTKYWKAETFMTNHMLILIYINLHFIIINKSFSKYNIIKRPQDINKIHYQITCSAQPTLRNYSQLSIKKIKNVKYVTYLPHCTVSNVNMYSAYNVIFAIKDIILLK